MSNFFRRNFVPIAAVVVMVAIGFAAFLAVRDSFLDAAEARTKDIKVAERFEDYAKVRFTGHVYGSWYAILEDKSGQQYLQVRDSSPIKINERK